MSELPKSVEIEKADALLLQRVFIAFKQAEVQKDQIGQTLMQKYVPEGNAQYRVNIDAGRFELIEEPNG